MLEDEAILRGIVRGERPWQDATLLGMTVERGPGGWLRADFSRDVHLDVTLRELADGLLLVATTRRHGHSPCMR